MYLLIRCSPLIEQSEVALSIIMLTGGITAFFAASVGLFQNDIKKVIAYSTMSSIGSKSQLPYVPLVVQAGCMVMILIL